MTFKLTHAPSKTYSVEDWTWFSLQNFQKYKIWNQVTQKVFRKVLRNLRF